MKWYNSSNKNRITLILKILTNGIYLLVQVINIPVYWYLLEYQFIDFCLHLFRHIFDIDNYTYLILYLYNCTFTHIWTYIYKLAYNLFYVYFYIDIYIYIYISSSTCYFNNYTYFYIYLIAIIRIITDNDLIISTTEVVVSIVIDLVQSISSIVTNCSYNFYSCFFHEYSIDITKFSHCK